MIHCRTRIFILSASLLSSAALAQTVGAGSFNIPSNGRAATVGQTLTLSIPKRFGLHLHLSSWNLDLSNLSADGRGAAQNECWRAGGHSSGPGLSFTGRDFLLSSTGTVPVSAFQSLKDTAILSLLDAATYYGDFAADSTNPYSYGRYFLWGSNRTDIQQQVPPYNKAPIGGYPGFYVNAGKLEWKGPIMCHFQTIVQKFSNSSRGFQFTAALSRPSTAVSTDITLPRLYIRDAAKPETNTAGVSFAPAKVLTPGGLSETLASSEGTTGGWLDDQILQVLVFDGSETAGTYKGTVTYTLTDLTEPVLIEPIPGCDPIRGGLGCEL